MRQNPERRTALTDAAITVLAREGARGLTYRAVDVEADVPPGTTSNYFRNRDQLLGEVGVRVHERLSAPADVMAESPSHDRVGVLLGELMGRLTAHREPYLALLELRLEATRRPDLSAELTKTIREGIDMSVDWHIAAGMPGGRPEVLLMYLALTGLTVERLTLPEVLADVTDKEIIRIIVDRVLPS
ncbi:TetR/AcrR family transcriptional regulator [Amycolatopsis sp. TNS106]|uniref:TetR/AcrR family transcriptional regulator n=1 Tax=Amycolatopsis sp. TNS106 TaxID=2861750 RepID=UPI001C5A0A2E|nr:TetR/AcrR family transcriptional regulator [Amycolatopsis sp. TNS106]QXV58857.1 TetR family transcriptional regulator [Amycolatopsis sp. TNS106]